MKQIYIPLLCTAFIFSGCSTYKNSQTPDDVYYSPGQGKEAYSSNDNNSNSDYYSTPNDQYVHMRVQDPSRWSYFDDYNSDYYGGYSPLGYSPYYSGGFGYGYGYTPWIGFSYWSPFSFWNSYYSWNSFYNPYYGGIIVVNPKIASSTNYTRLGTFNPASYTNNTYSRSNVRTSNYTPYSYSQTIRRSYSNSNSSRPVFNRPNNSNTSQPVRSYSPSSNSSIGGSRSSVGGGGGGGGRSMGGRPGR